MAVEDKIEFGTNFKTIADFLQWWLNNDLLIGDEQRVFKAYYESYYKNFTPYVKSHYTNQTLELMALLQPANHDRPLRILEIGCGCGTESLWFALHGANVIGTDIREDRLQTARARASILHKMIDYPLQVQFKNISLFDLESNAGYDIIWMEQAFHHIEPRFSAYSKFAGLLKKGGWLVISETNALNPLIQIMLLKKRGVTTISSYVDSFGMTHRYGKERITTAACLNRNLSSVGISTVSVRHYRVLPNHPLADKFALIERIIPGWILPAFTHYNYVGRKTNDVC